MKNYQVDLNANDQPYFLKIQGILNSSPRNSYCPPINVYDSFSKGKSSEVRIMLDGAKACYTRVVDAYHHEVFTFSGVAKVEGFSLLLEGELSVSINPNLELFTCLFYFPLGDLRASISLRHMQKESYILEDLTQCRPLAQEIRRLIDAGEIKPCLDSKGGQ